MGKYDSLTLIPPAGRKDGITYANAGLITTQRAATIPLQPKTPIQAHATQNLAWAAAQWANVPDYGKDIWNARAIPPQTGYSLFLAYMQLQLTWGILPFNLPLSDTYSAEGPYVFFNSFYNLSGRLILQVWPDVDLTINPVYVPTYVAWNCTRTITFPGTTDPGFQSGLPVPKYVFLKIFGPCVPQTQNNFDITDDVRGTIGYLPPSPTDDFVRRLITAAGAPVMFYITVGATSPSFLYNPLATKPPYHDRFTFGNAELP